MKAYSVDLRERVLAAVDAGTPHAEIVRVLRVSLASVLCPVLRTGQVGIMDNLSVHKTEAVREKTATRVVGSTTAAFLSLNHFENRCKHREYNF